MSEQKLIRKSDGAIRRGRPPGSKNRPKPFTTAVAISSLKEKIGAFLPAEDMDYLVNILDGGDSPVLQKDLDIFLALQLKALLPQLAEEIKTGQLTREATQRSSTVKELLALRFQMEKQKDGDDKPNSYTFIQNIFESRGIDSDRVAALLARPVGGSSEEQPSPVARTLHGDEGRTDEAGAVSD